MKVCSTQAAAHAAVDKSIMWSLQSLIAMQWLGKSQYQSIMAEILRESQNTFYTFTASQSTWLLHYVENWMLQYTVTTGCRNNNTLLTNYFNFVFEILVMCRLKCAHTFYRFLCLTMQ